MQKKDTRNITKIYPKNVQRSIRVSDEVLKLLNEAGFKSLQDYLDSKLNYDFKTIININFSPAKDDWMQI